MNRLAVRPSIPDAPGLWEWGLLPVSGAAGRVKRGRGLVSIRRTLGDSFGGGGRSAEGRIKLFSPDLPLAKRLRISQILGPSPVKRGHPQHLLHRVGVEIKSVYLNDASVQ